MIKFRSTYPQYKEKIMQISSDYTLNNLNALKINEKNLEQSAQTIAQVANTVGEPQNQEVTQDLVDAIVGQIPTVIAYEANAKAIETVNAVSDTLLNIKA
jgi:flagellar hook protein FlgE